MDEPCCQGDDTVTSAQPASSFWDILKSNLSRLTEISLRKRLMSHALPLSEKLLPRTACFVTGAIQSGIINSRTGSVSFWSRNVRKLIDHSASILARWHASWHGHPICHGRLEIKPTNPNAHTYVNGTDVKTHGFAVTRNTFLQ